MTYLYLCVFDISVEREDPRYADYVCVPTSHDIAGLVTAKAQANGSDVKDIRMHAYSKKNMWEQARQELYTTITNWGLADKPIKRKIKNQ